jgi:hypothetical protein
MPHKTRRAIRDDEMPFAFAHGQTRRQLRRPRPGGTHAAAAEMRSVSQQNATFGNSDFTTTPVRSSAPTSLASKRNCAAHGGKSPRHPPLSIHPPSRDADSARPWRRRSIEHFHAHAALVKLLLPMHLRHFLGIRRDPQRAAGSNSTSRGKLRPQLPARAVARNWSVRIAPRNRPSPRRAPCPPPSCRRRSAALQHQRAQSAARTFQPHTPPRQCRPRR